MPSPGDAPPALFGRICQQMPCQERKHRRIAGRDVVRQGARARPIRMPAAAPRTVYGANRTPKQGARRPCEGAATNGILTSPYITVMVYSATAARADEHVQRTTTAALLRGTNLMREGSCGEPGKVPRTQQHPKKEGKSRGSAPRPGTSRAKRPEQTPCQPWRIRAESLRMCDFATCADPWPRDIEAQPGAACESGKSSGNGNLARIAGYAHTRGEACGGVRHASSVVPKNRLNAARPRQRLETAPREAACKYRAKSEGNRRPPRDTRAHRLHRAADPHARNGSCTLARDVPNAETGQAPQ